MQEYNVMYYILQIYTAILNLYILFTLVILLYNDESKIYHYINLIILLSYYLKNDVNALID